jgi:hypothetical protein
MIHAAVVLKAALVLGMLAGSDGAGCTNTFSGLTQCAVLNGQTTDANTAVMQNPELYWLDQAYTGAMSPDTGTTECRAAFNAFNCVNWAYGAGAGPCKNGTGMPPCFSLCADWVQKCFQRMPNRESIDGRATEFSTGAVNGAKTGMQSVILTLDAAGIDNVDTICSRLAPEQNATKCFGDVAGFTRRTCTHTLSGLTTCAVLNGEAINVQPQAPWFYPSWILDLEKIRVSNPWNENMRYYGTRTEECLAAYNSFFCAHWAHKFGAGPCKNGTAMRPCFSLCADYVQKCFPPRWPDENAHWVTFRPGAGVHGLSLMETEVRIDIAGTDNVDAICSVLGIPRNATNCFGDVANFTRLPPAAPPPTTPPPTTPPPQFTFLPPPSAATTAATTWRVIFPVLLLAVMVLIIF